MARPGRPRKPGYKSIAKVLDAIRSCSCGRFERWARRRRSLQFLAYLRYKYECPCIGPKSWSQLLTLTNLHRDTLSKTCKFLCSREVLIRRVLPKRGHHVEYSISDAYHENEALRPEIEHSAKGRRETRRLTLKIFRNPFFAMRQKFERDYQATIDLVNARWGAGRLLGSTEYMYLVRLVHIFGPEDGMRLFLGRLKQLRARKFRTFAGNFTYSNRDLRRLSAYYRSVDRSMKDVRVVVDG